MSALTAKEEAAWVRDFAVRATRGLCVLRTMLDVAGLKAGVEVTDALLSEAMTLGLAAEVKS